MTSQPRPEHQDAFAAALGTAQDALPPGGQLVVDRLWGKPPHVATVTVGTRIIAGSGETPAAALRDLAVQLRRMSPQESD